MKLQVPSSSSQACSSKTFSRLAPMSRKSFTATMLKLGASLVLGVWSLGFSSALAAEHKVDFNRDIRPIFSDTCFKCHGPDEKARKAKLRFDVRDDAIKEHKQGTPIVPGSRAKSEAWLRINATDPDDHMPPPDSGRKLTPEQIQMIGRWIDQGAEYQVHWSLIPPKHPALPVVKNKRWPANAIDNFILARIEGEGLKPTPEA